MGRVIWATEGTAGNVLRDLFVYKLICRPHEERTVPSFWAAESADLGKQKLLPSPLLLPWCPRASGLPTLNLHPL